jgi:FSR family fosmidomycin resistance protein-like MFS transporter
MRHRVRGVSTLALGHAVNDSYAYVLQAMLPAIVPTLGLTLGMVGGLVSLYQVISSVIQPAIGYVADRTTLRWPAWVGVGMSSLAAGLLGLAPNYATLLGLLVIGGMGTAIFHPVSAAMAGASAPSRSRGRWLGLYVSAGNFGLAFGPLAVGALVHDGNVAAAWPIMLPGLACAAIVALLGAARPYSDAARRLAGVDAASLWPHPRRPVACDGASLVGRRRDHHLRSAARNTARSQP